MNFIEYIYNIFYLDIFKGDLAPTTYMYHEISLILTYISLILLFIGIFKFFKWLLKSFKLGGR